VRRAPDGVEAEERLLHVAELLPPVEVVEGARIHRENGLDTGRQARIARAGVHEAVLVPRVGAEAPAVVSDDDFVLSELADVQHADVELGHAHLHDLLLSARRDEPDTVAMGAIIGTLDAIIGTLRAIIRTLRAIISFLTAMISIVSAIIRTLRASISIVRAIISTLSAIISLTAPTLSCSPWVRVLTPRGAASQIGAGEVRAQ
jgi:hypothetical protein